MNHCLFHGMTRRGLLTGAGATIGAERLMTLWQASAQGIKPKHGGGLTTFITPEPPILINAINFQSPTIIVGSKIYQGPAGAKYRHPCQSGYARDDAKQGQSATR